MQALNDRVDPDEFFSKLNAAGQSALLLDYDGTLAPFHVQREKALPYPGVQERLRTLAESGSTRTVIVSGRKTDDVVKLLGLEKPPEIWGCHGAERRQVDGSLEIATLSDPAAAGLEAAEKWAGQQHLQKHCERKPTGLAFHWRGLTDDEADSIRRQVESRWQDEAANSGLMLKPFDGGLELRSAHFHKGRVVAWILDNLDQTSPVAYLGDDLTDEDAFAALAGRGLNVLVRKELRQSRADLWVVPPEELLGFLDRWLGCVR